jgi:hypothetical protein
VCFVLLLCFVEQKFKKRVKISDVMPYLIGGSFVFAFALMIDLLLIKKGLNKSKKSPRKRT